MLLGLFTLLFDRAAVGGGLVQGGFYYHSILVMAPSAAVDGKYLKGDFHNHSTFTDGACSVQTLINASVKKCKLDWFIQSGHGGAFSRDGREDDFATDCEVDGQGQQLDQQAGQGRHQGRSRGSGPLRRRKMWRWQSLQEFNYPAVYEKSIQYNRPIILGFEFNVPGHEHCSSSIIAGQFQFDADNADALAQFEYLFDASDDDTSRGGGQGWDGKEPTCQTARMQA